MRGHRSAAQNGQNSAPTNRTSGFPDASSGGWWVSTVGATRGKVVVTPTESKTEVGIRLQLGDHRRRGRDPVDDAG